MASITPIESDDPAMFLQHILNGPDDTRPRILLLGLGRSGKTTIQQAVFEQVSSHETVFLASTEHICKFDYPGLPVDASQSLINIQVLDFPSPEKLRTRSYVPYLQALSSFVFSIVFVVDSSVDEINKDVVDNIVSVAHAVSHCPQVSLDILIHKLDPEISRSRGETVFSDWEAAILEDLHVPNINIKFYGTSMLDHSLLEACSHILQRMIPWSGEAQRLLDGLVGSSSLERAMLLDAYSKLYIAADFSVVDTATYELCSSFVETAVDTTYIYEAKERANRSAERKGTEDSAGEHITGVIRLSNGLVLYLKQISATLVLVATTYSQSLSKRGILEYNIKQFKNAIEEIARKYSRNNVELLD